MHTLQSVAINPQNKSNEFRVPYYDNPLLEDPRVERAEEIFSAYEHEHGEEGEHVRNLAEMLCDFALWCDRNGLQLSEALKIAAKRYSAETEGQGRQFKHAV